MKQHSFRPSYRYQLFKRWTTLIALVVLAYRLVNWYSSRSYKRGQAAPQIADNGIEKVYRVAWSELSWALQISRPAVRSVLIPDALPAISIKDNKHYLKEEAIEMQIKDLEVLQKSHASFVRSIGQGRMSSVFQKESRGIVVTANGDLLPSVLVQLRLLRKTGSTLPVEVFLLLNADYDEYICGEMFAELNARCQVLHDYLEAAVMPRLAEQRQARHIRPNEALHKYLAVFFSSFEDNLVLDSATLVLNNPDYLMEEEPYLTSKLILWPDYWLASTSPTMYKIQQDNLSRINRTISVDLGQFAISKSSHFSTLLLSIYYTYYGENLYDTLLKQSSAGDAGSQAIKAASDFVEMPAHTLQQHPVEAIGYSDNYFRDVAMLQSFPIQVAQEDEMLPAFIRSTTTPALSPSATSLGHTLYHPINGTLTPHKLWQESQGLVKGGNEWQEIDPEIALWAEMKRVACEDSTFIHNWPASIPSQCDIITKYMKSMSFLA